jgi:hypothetical protein
MISERLLNFRTVPELQEYLDNEINMLKQKSDEFSKVIGEKLRSTESNDNAELQELRQKLEGTTTEPKKKKSVKKKDQKNNWYNFDSISIFDGIGPKGELELYFKGMEETKLALDKITKIKQGIDDIVNKGLKKELGCVLLLNNELPAEVAFTNGGPQRKKFAYKSIFSTPKDELYEVQISQ